MPSTLPEIIDPSTGRSLARAFSRLGWAGFWFQVVLGSLPIIVMIYYLAFSGSPTASRSGLPFIEYLAIANLLTLLFTVFWSYRYTKLAKRIVDPARTPSASSIIGTVWTGVTASTIGMFVSMIVVLIEAANLLFYFLKAPQGGIPVVQTGGAESQHWVSSVDMVSLVALILTLFAELMALIFSLWLLGRATRSLREPV
jgi:Protein of unknown function (DUF3611)